RQSMPSNGTGHGRRPNDPRADSHPGLPGHGRPISGRAQLAWSERPSFGPAAGVPVFAAVAGTDRPTDSPLPPIVGPLLPCDLRGEPLSRRAWFFRHPSPFRHGSALPVGATAIMKSAPGGLFP